MSSVLEHRYRVISSDTVSRTGSAKRLCKVTVPCCAVQREISGSNALSCDRALVPMMLVDHLTVLVAYRCLLGQPETLR